MYQAQDRSTKIKKKQNYELDSWMLYYLVPSLGSILQVQQLSKWGSHTLGIRRLSLGKSNTGSLLGSKFLYFQFL